MFDEHFVRPKLFKHCWWQSQSKERKAPKRNYWGDGRANGAHAKASKGTNRCIGSGQLLPSCLSNANLSRVGRRGVQGWGF